MGVLKDTEDMMKTSKIIKNILGIVNLTGRSGLQKTIASVNFEENVAGIVLDVSPTKIPADGISISSVIIKIKDNNENFITSPDGWIVEMSTTLGTLTNPVNIAPGMLSGIAILTSGNKTGTATITATMGTFRSEKKVVFEELPERYCMHCGDPMKRDMKSCPNCKKTPPSNAEIKECYSCNSIIPASAGFCDRCGAKQPV